MSDIRTAEIYDDIRGALHAVTTAVLAAFRAGNEDGPETTGERTAIDISRQLDQYPANQVALVAASVVADLLRTFDALDDWPELLADYEATLGES